MCCWDSPRAPMVALRDPGPDPRPPFCSSGTGDGDGDGEGDGISIEGLPATVAVGDDFNAAASPLSVVVTEVVTARLLFGLVASARTNTEATVKMMPSAGDQARTMLAALASTRHTAHTAGTEDREPRRSHHMDGPTAAAPRTTSEQRRGLPSVVVARPLDGTYGPSAVLARRPFSRCGRGPAVALRGSSVTRLPRSVGARGEQCVCVASGSIEKDFAREGPATTWGGFDDLWAAK